MKLRLGKEKQRLPLSVQEERRLRRSREGKEVLLPGRVGLIALVVALLFALFVPKSSPDYYYYQGALLVGCVLVILSVFAILRVHKAFWNDVRKAWRRDADVTDREKASAYWTVDFILALIGLLVADWGAFSHGGIRLTAVVGIAGARILWALMRGR